MPNQKETLNLRSRLSRINNLRKRYVRNHKLQAHLQKYLAHADASEIECIRQALSLLHPEKIDIPMLRVGSDNDGGYLVPDDLVGISALFSPGVSSEIGFDLEISKRGVECFLADASVQAPENLPTNVHFAPNFIGTSNDYPFITMRKWVDDSAPNAPDLMLQMDIEGAEYEVLSDVGNDLLLRFRIILLELHDIHRITEATWRENFVKVLTKLNKNHILCHLHGNNTAGFFRFDQKYVPQVVELSYIRAERVMQTGLNALIPHPLDQPNSKKIPEIPIPLFWQSIGENAR